jgi:YD repeat-containing protein
VTLTYNQREASQPATFGWFNVSQKWTLNWLSYIQNDPGAPGANVMRYVAGGGSINYSGYNTGTGAFTPETRDASVLVETSPSPVTYKRQLPDGSLEIYSKSDGSTSYPRRTFLTQVIDPAGNAVTLSYDSQLRLTSLTDATGRATTFTYGLAGHPLLITSITDPFGRSSQLAYDSNGRLSQITDVLGLKSQFTYDA